MTYTQNQNKAKSYLTRIRDAGDKIKSKEIELDALRYKASGAGAIRYDKDKIMTSVENYLEMAIADIMEIEQEIEEEKAAIDESMGIAYAIVRQIAHPMQRAVIEWFYLNCVSMTETANNIHMSERNAYFLRDEALESFGNIMNE